MITQLVFAQRSVLKQRSVLAQPALLSNVVFRTAPIVVALTCSGCTETQTDGPDAAASSGSSTSADTATNTAGSSSSQATTSVTSSNVSTAGSSAATSAQGTTGSSNSSVGATGASGTSSGGSTSADGEAGITAIDAGTTTVTADAGVGTSDASTSDATAGTPDDDSMSFFVTSSGNTDGGDLGGLEGADAFCTQLAAAVSESLGSKVWHAYLSTSTVNARDRIGTGPWRNADGIVVANNVEQLHAQEADEALDGTWPPGDLSIALTENGDQVPNSIHDILTGSLPDGTVDPDRHCNDWTSSETTDEASVGHSNRDGGGRPPYFNATHQVGCAPSAMNYQDGTVTAGGGQGSLYCFAVTTN